MRKVAALVAGIVATFAAGLGAQDAYYAFRFAYIDTVIEAPQPCGSRGLMGPVSMTVYDRNAWLVYTCADNRVVLRRYKNPNDNAVDTPIDRTVPPPTTAPEPVLLTIPQMQGYASWGVSFISMASGTPVPGSPGKVFVRVGAGWAIQDAQ